MSTVHKAVVADRSAGVVLASAAGDALGAPHEFGPALAESVPLRMTGGGSFGWKQGEWTDDTQMALALLTPLSQGVRDVAPVEQGFLAWYANGPKDVGNQTRAVLGHGAPLRDAARRHTESRPRASAGNGGLMRIGPAGLSYPRDPARIAAYASAVTELTHADRDCLDASVLWAVAIDHTIHNAPDSSGDYDFVDAVKVGLAHVDGSRRARWEQLIDEAAAAPPVAFDRNGWVIHAFQCALSSIIHATPAARGAPSTHLRSAIEMAVRAGGDTDTVAAIAGALVGARWGATAVPLEWRTVLRGERRHGEPALSGADLDAMARLAANGGAPDSAGWPGRERFIPYYRERYRGGPRPIKLGGARFGGIGGLETVLHGVDAVVSLCRMGTADVPATVEHVCVGLVDGPPETNPNLAFLLADTADYIAGRVAAGRSVYTHCVAADNRAPTVAAAYLARHGGMDAEAALSAMREAFGHEPYPYLMDGVRAAATLP